MSIQQFLPTAGTVILPSDISPIHYDYRWIDMNTKLPFGSQAVCDGINFHKIEIQGKNYAIPHFYNSELATAKDEEGNDVRILSKIRLRLILVKILARPKGSKL